MKELLNKLDNILDSAISIVETAFELPETAQYTRLSAPPTATPIEGNEELFEDIYGHENIKALLNMALRSQKAVHVC